MASLGEVLSLMHRARTTYSWVELHVRTWARMDLEWQATHRWAERQPPGTVATTTSGDGEHAEWDPEWERFWESSAHLWVNDATRWWLEIPERDHVQARDGDRWWTSDRSGGYLVSTGARTSVTDYGPMLETQPYEELWDPGLLISELWLGRSGGAVVAGRDGILVKATPRPTPRPDGQDFILLRYGVGDEYELVVDAERGVVVRLTGFLDGEVMSVEEVTRIEFDSEPPAGLFDVPYGALQGP